jgi:bla regulator protein BlaR1
VTNANTWAIGGRDCRRVSRVIACGCLVFSLGGQTAEFEVASIKPNPSLPLMIIGPGVGKGEVTGTRVTLRALVMAAYDVSAPRVIGPGWLDGDRFDVIAKAASRNYSQDETRAMLRTLLKDRFHLVAHVETREMPVYDLVVAKGGVKMPEHGTPAADGPQPERKKYPGVKNIGSMGGTLTTAQIAYYLSGPAGRPVVDKTGLAGRWDYFISYMPNLPTDGDAAELGPPDLFTAVEQEMGLKLHPSKAELSVVVVDHMDRMPTEN